jgi:hypothetical protein
MGTLSGIEGSWLAFLLKGCLRWRKIPPLRCVLNMIKARCEAGRRMLGDALYPGWCIRDVS